MSKRLAPGILAFALAGCGPTSGIGFHLPEGSAQLGRRAFTDLGCNACHEIEGVPHAGGAGAVSLGGPTTRVRTYGELVTSIINPSHRLAPRYADSEAAADGDSPMAGAALNDVMTVQQLIDLVAFLRSTYEIVEPQRPAPWRIYPESDFGRHDVAPRR
jgi:mono/diheme cytochrome c family protein